MEIKAKRTLVKSAPELWELADDLARLETWMGGFVGAESPVEIEITERVPERTLGWRTSCSQADAEIKVALAESGFGTSVEIRAKHEGVDPAAGIALEKLLDDLGSPDRRPFSSG